MKNLPFSRRLFKKKEEPQKARKKVSRKSYQEALTIPGIKPAPAISRKQIRDILNLDK